jgi:hypothetical protein
MSFSQHYEERRGAGCFSGLLSRCGRDGQLHRGIQLGADGPIILDTSLLLGRSMVGEAAVLNLARGVSALLSAYSVRRRRPARADPDGQPFDFGDRVLDALGTGRVRT